MLYGFGDDDSEVHCSMSGTVDLILIERLDIIACRASEASCSDISLRSGSYKVPQLVCWNTSLSFSSKAM